MRIFYLFIYRFTICVGFAQKATPTQVPSTKCSLIPPENFVPATGFSGFQNNENGASIMINELPGPYTQISEGFTQEALKTRGMHLIGKQVIDFNQGKATFITVSQIAGGKKFLKQIVMFGDRDKTILVNGIYPEEAKAIEQEIKASLLSTVYNPTQNDDPFARAKFSIDVSNTHFKFAKYLSGTFLYTEDGQLPSRKAMLIAGNSIGKVVIPDRKQYAIERLKQLPNGGEKKIQKMEPITLDKMSGYEIIAQGKNEHLEEELIYQVILFPNNSEYFLLVGITATDKEKNLSEFKRITQTFKRR